MKRVILLGGPTASGKSALALELAEALAARGQPAEILCADSVTVYRGFDIGAAKPTAADRRRVPHHLLDLTTGDQTFTAGDFIKAANPLLDSLLAGGVTPIVVGGTGFYLRALLRGMASEEENQAQARSLKSALEARARSEGWEALFRELMERDPGSAGTIHPNDHYRIVRALQAMALQGKPWSELNKTARATAPRFPYRFFRLAVTKEELKDRIEARTERMLRAGLIEEARELLRNVGAGAKPMQSIGYKEAVAFLEGTLPENELAAAINQATLKLSKQQLTWFRGEELAEWLDPPTLPRLLELLKD